MVDSTMFSKYYICFSIFIYIYYIKGDKIEIQIISKMYGTIDGSFRPSPVIINKTILAHTEKEITMQQQGVCGVSILLYKNIFVWVTYFFWGGAKYVLDYDYDYVYVYDNNNDPEII